jgi:hypothetical protein
LVGAEHPSLLENGVVLPLSAGTTIFDHRDLRIARRFLRSNVNAQAA